MDVEIEAEKFSSLANAIHGHRGEIKLLANLEAYMDESADKQRRMFVIGGFMARSDVWREILLDWASCIRDPFLPNRISAFHMTDCEGRGGEFQDKYGWTDETRHKLRDNLIDILCSHGPIGMFGFGVRVEEYQALEPVTEKGLKLGYSQYHLLLQTVMSYMAMELEDNDFAAHESIAFFFDRYSKYETWANILHKELQSSGKPWTRRIGALAFDSKTNFQLLQVADLGAFESRRYLTHKAFGDGSPGPGFQKLADNHCIWNLSAWNSDGLTKMVELKKESLRQIAAERKLKRKR